MIELNSKYSPNLIRDIFKLVRIEFTRFHIGNTTFIDI